VNKQSKKLTIIGSGMWGSALATLALRNRHQVTIWSRKGEISLETAIKEAEVILSAVSMSGVNPVAKQLQKLGLSSDLIIVTATKGLDRQTNQTPSQIWQQTFPNCPIVVLSGPNLSKEIQQGLPAATVVASKHLLAAQTIQEIFASENFRVYVNQDPLGTELGGTLKNVMAIAAGVCDGLQLGTNAKAALLTRALPEMIRVGSDLGAIAETFFGLSGLGDLLATCNSPLSRNYQVGYQLAKGKNISQILSNLEGTAEGINTTQVLMNLANSKALTVPITYQVYRLLQGETTPQEAVIALMERTLKAEMIN
jgi:glycerol-3-phosphate dehydrogenase (NAD(P)+)